MKIWQGRKITIILFLCFVKLSIIVGFRVQVKYYERMMNGSLQNVYQHNNQIKTVLIVARGRTGSNLLTELLSHGTDHFSTYEPIRIVNSLFTYNTTRSKLQLLEQLIRCKFEDSYYKQARYLNPQIWKYTALSSEICYSSYFLCKNPHVEEAFCTSSSLHVIKTTAISMKQTCV